MKCIVILLSIVLVIILIPIIYYGPWIYFSYKMKSNYVNTFAIQNVAFNKDIRVYNVNVEDKTKVILYQHKNWECLTWQFIQLEKDTYLLKNLVTQKTFEPSSKPQSGIFIWQRSLGGSSLQYWKFLKQKDETYLIKLKNSELYLTATSDKDNSEIILLPLQNSRKQLWRLIKQNPIYDLN